MQCIKSVLFLFDSVDSDLEIVEHDIAEILRLSSSFRLAPDCAHEFRIGFLGDLHESAEKLLDSLTDILGFLREIIFDCDSLGFVIDRELAEAVFIVHAVCDAEHVAALLLLKADEVRHAHRDIVCLVAGDKVCSLIPNLLMVFNRVMSPML